MQRDRILGHTWVPDGVEAQLISHVSDLSLPILRLSGLGHLPLRPWGAGDGEAFLDDGSLEDLH